jgi:hypothetical protein
MIHDPVKHALQVAFPVFFASSYGGDNGSELLCLWTEQLLVEAKGCTHMGIRG